MFFASSATQSFASDDIRAAFRERWLGRYLEHYPDWVYVGLDPDGAVVGYVIAGTDDPARTPLFADIGYFKDFAPVTLDYPVQLHVNLAPEWRGHGIGSRMINHVCDELSAGAFRGAHVVTTPGMRNVGYYAANGFHEVASVQWNGRDLVMLGRRLAAD